MKVSSKKAKGRVLQNWVRTEIIKTIKIRPDHVRTAVMGETGADVQLLTSTARKRFPFRIECKNQEAMSHVYEAYHQACHHKGDGEPIVFIKKNRQKPLVVIDAEYFIRLFKYDDSSNDDAGC